VKGTKEVATSEDKAGCHSPLQPRFGRFFAGGSSLPGAWRTRVLALFSLLAACTLVSCRPDMANQPKAKPLSHSDFFANGASARQPPSHTVAFGKARDDAAFYTGLTNGVYITQLPIKLTPELLHRGRERFEAICAVCHDRTGSGNGMIVQRGFPQPPSFHVDRLRNAPIGHFYDVISNGYGVMYPYAARVEPEDRWAIAAYIRALQLSHNANPSDVDLTARAKLEAVK
jgi:mono/diheme cytochrome c family protein